MSRLRFVLGLLVTLLAFGPAVPWAAAQQGAAPPTPETVGIRIVDAPTNRADDPRARLYIVDHLAPGTKIQRRVEVDNNTSAPQPVQLYAAAADVNGGEFHFGDGRAVSELTTWTTVDPPSATLAPGARQLATVTIDVPADASPGERYAVVWVELAAAAPPGGGITAVNRVGVRVYLSVGPGGEPPSDFAITTLEAQRAADGSPVVSATVHNTGGRALDLGGELRLSNGPGGLTAGPFQAKLGTTLGLGQTEPVMVTLDKAIPAGPWEARIALRSGLTERQASALITFPTQPAASSGPVKAVPTSAGGGGGVPTWAVGVGGAAAVGGVGSAALRIRSRKRAGRSS